MTTAIAKLPTGQLDTMTLAKAFAASGYFQDARDMAQAIVKIQCGAELGIPAVAAMRSIYIVKGKTTLEASTIGGLVKKSGKYDYRIIEHTAEACELVFSEKGQEVGRSRFTMADAQKAGLTGNETYRKFPRNMLFARAMTNGARWYCAEVFQGPIYTPDELGATVDPITGDVSVTAETPAVPQRQRLLDAVKEPESEVPQLPAPTPSAKPEPQQEEPVKQQEINADEAFTIQVAEALDARGIPSNRKTPDGKATYAELRKRLKVSALLNLHDDERKQLAADIAGGKYDELKKEAK